MWFISCKIHRELNITSIPAITARSPLVTIDDKTNTAIEFSVVNTSIQRADASMLRLCCVCLCCGLLPLMWCYFTARMRLSTLLSDVKCNRCNYSGAGRRDGAISRTYVGRLISA